VESLSQKIASIDASGFLDTSILGEVVHPQNFNTLRRIEQEDGKVVEEQEQFAELVSSEFLLQNLKNLLDAGMRTSLEALPDGIHSGLVREGAKGIFFYFSAAGNGASRSSGSRAARQHFWRYIDLSEERRGGRIEDNRYVITSRISCQPDTARVVPADGEVDIFALQEKVIGSIVQSSVEQVAVEEAPKQLDPIQQRIATVLRSYSNSPAVSRKDVIAAIQQLNVPLPGVYVKTLRKAYEAFTATTLVDELLAAVQSLSQEQEKPASTGSEGKAPVRREDSKLICFDYTGL